MCETRRGEARDKGRDARGEAGHVTRNYKQQALVVCWSHQGLGKAPGLNRRRVPAKFFAGRRGPASRAQATKFFQSAGSRQPGRRIPATKFFQELLAWVGEQFCFLFAKILGWLLAGSVRLIPRNAMTTSGGSGCFPGGGNLAATCKGKQRTRQPIGTTGDVGN